MVFKKMVFKKIALISLCLLSSIVIADDCILPDNLNKKQILFLVSEVYTPTNPDAGSVIQLNFTDKKIVSTKLIKGILSQGQYEYEIIAPGVALLSVKLTEGDDRAHFRTVMMCENDYSGMYIFSQSEGIIEPSKRQNTGSYIIE
ncbi:hypothetical protein [uncultured Shewanella sp.]|uniref:hypothetical protein n=1 Tax=uncultured Shewanella sp. TaxID=173975 RepID=UPI0026164EB9|nr:hypothetical protein [uncultured Shewanella sp.]